MFNTLLEFSLTHKHTFKVFLKTYIFNLHTVDTQTRVP